jgi:hypothetical protein
MSNGEQRSDPELLLAARTSSEPFGAFYERHFASVLAFFRRRVPGPEEAFDRLTDEGTPIAQSGARRSAGCVTTKGVGSCESSC